MLHNKKDTFEQLVLRTSEYLGVKAEIVEKDYFVTLFLKRIAAVMPDIVFKGGTSLSKCYHIIKRFSEDIDLNLQSEIKPPERKRRQLKANIIQIINDLEFELMLQHFSPIQWTHTALPSLRFTRAAPFLPSRSLKSSMLPTFPTTLSLPTTVF